MGKVEIYFYFPTMAKTLLVEAISTSISLKSVSELLGKSFFIPSYQRGYRWTKQQVKDLLDDIQEFIDKKQESFYCIQPLVVKKNIFKQDELKKELEANLKKENLNIDNIEELIFKHINWEVVDGQQRLTTIYILISFLGRNKKCYEIEYETREESKSFLLNLTDESELDKYDQKYIDYHYIIEAKNEINEWFKNKELEEKQKFFNSLLEDVKFIWYELAEENPIKVFTRLNIGKIPLTNAELVKALFLNQSNFEGGDQKIRLQQQEIACEWDIIEYTLQNDEFWLFLNNLKYDNPTRIDSIFDLMCEKDSLDITDDEKKEIGTDEYKTFRYFYAWFEKNRKNGSRLEKIKKCWQKIKSFFQIFQEWFNDLELYHYIGFLIENGVNITTIIDKWEKLRQKDEFMSTYIIQAIKDVIKIKEEVIDFAQNYDEEGSPKKTECRPVLLLHNIQTVINQNKNIKKNERYKLPVFYKFPFHLYKKEEWHIEHIASSTDNSLKNPEEQKGWLKYSCEFINDDCKMETGENLKKEIDNFIDDDANKKEFEILRDAVEKSISNSDRLETEKNRLWNFTLLDSKTNTSYKNAIFPLKRSIIIGKDQGKKITVNEKFETEERDAESAFIPPCTKNVFMKYYNPVPNNLREWDRKDAEKYEENIKKVLEIFLKEKET